MTKIVFCTIAAGEVYQKMFANFIDKVSTNNLDINFLCVIDKDHAPLNNKCQYINIPSDHKIFIQHGYRQEFNFNLKFLPIKYSHEYSADYIIYIDADWQAHDNFCMSKVYKFLDKIQDYDLVYERPHPILGCKNQRDLFWKHKAQLYNLYETTVYDNAHVVNEQFLVIKNTDKVKIFVDSWEQRNIICLENHVRPWAEGVEIGMSYTDAQMSTISNYHNIMKECFTFKSKGGKEYIRW